MLPSLLRRARRGAALSAVAALAACDLPSEMPILQQTWVVPADSVTVGAADLVPDGVTVFDGPAQTFEVSSPVIDIATTLGEVCGQPECQVPGTVTAPTPAFRSADDLLSASLTFPAGITSATVLDGAFGFDVTNNLGFDPLRPNGNVAPYGELIITITSGATTFTDTLTGATQSMPNGQTTEYFLLLPTGTYTSSVDIALVFDVPAGQPAAMNASNGLAIAASLDAVSLSQATIAVVDEAITTTPSDFDLEDVDFGDQVEGGALLLTVDNPLTASADLDVVLEAPAQDGQPAVLISRAINVPAQPTSTAEVTLSRNEIQSLLGKTGVTISVTGAVNGTGAGNTITLTPDSRITVRSQLSLTLNVGA